MAVPVTEAAQAAENFKFKPELNCVTVTEYDIQFRPSLYIRYWYDIEVSIRYRIRYRIAISGYNDIQGKNFDVVHDIGAMSAISKILRYRTGLISYVTTFDIVVY
jgi:hypothetical protein